MVFALFRISKIKSLFLILVALGCVSEAEAAIYYVKADAPAGGNGTSWKKAFNSLDTALNAAGTSSGADQIWIASGIYKPTIKYGGTYGGLEENLKTFKLPSNVALYGGFSGTEKNLGQRDCDVNRTVLSGDLSGNDVNDLANAQNFKEDNAWHVLTADGVTGVTLNCLTVRGGYASGPDAGTVDSLFRFITLDYAHAAGGGILARHGAQVTLNNTMFEFNATDRKNVTLVRAGFPGSPALASGGGAVAVIDDGTVVTSTNSIYNQNTAFGVGGNGGALNALFEASYKLMQSSFTNNTADRIGGAVHAKDAGDIKVVLSKFANNQVVGGLIGDESGGGIGVIDSNLSVSASIFDSNSSGPIAGGGGVMFHTPFDDGEPYTLSVDTSIFKNNHSSAIGGGGINISGVMPNAGSKATITTSVFANNTGGTGGAVYVDSIPTDISNAIFTGNQALVEGGAVVGLNFSDAIFGVTNIADRKVLKISKSFFKNNAIVAVQATPYPPPLFVFNLFANVLSSVFAQPLALVIDMRSGGGAIAAGLGGNIDVSDSKFESNSAIGDGGAILVGGTLGCAGVAGCPTVSPSLGMNQAYVKLSNSICSNNSATVSGNNTAVLDLAGLGNGINGVRLDSDGSCP